MGRKASQSIKPKSLSLYMYQDTLDAIKRIANKYGLKADAEAIRLAINIVDASPKLIVNEKKVTIRVAEFEVISGSSGKETETDVFGDPMPEQHDEVSK